MRSHDFARKLLELPDLPLVVGDGEFAHELLEPAVAVVGAPHSSHIQVVVTGIGALKGEFPIGESNVQN